MVVARVLLLCCLAAQSSSLSFLAPGRVSIHRNFWASSFQRGVTRDWLQLHRGWYKESLEHWCPMALSIK